MSFEGDKVVELDDGKDECEKDFEDTGAEVCVQNVRNEVIACNVKIDEMHEDLEGGRGNTVKYNTGTLCTLFLYAK